MSAAVAAPAADRAARRRALEARATQQAFFGAFLMVWAVGLWLWVIFTAVQILVTLLLARFLELGDGNVVISIGPVGAPQIFLFVMGLVTGAGLLTIHVTAGGTRRSAVRGWLLAAPAVGATFAVVSVLVTALVRWISALAGSAPAVGPFLGAAPAVAALAVLGTAAFLAGVCGNAGYRRYGAGGGTLFLPVAIAPVVLAYVALLPAGGFASDTAVGPGADVAWWGWLLTVPCLAAAAALTWLLHRRIAIGAAG